MDYDKLLVGTAKGLVWFQYDQGKLKQIKVEFAGLNVSAIHQHFDGTLFIGVTHKHWGEKLYRKAPLDKQWKELSPPKFPKGYLTVQGKPATLKQIWNIQHGGRNFPDRLWIGTEPGALFKSEDRGESFELVESLWNHPTRIEGKQWFGAGKDLPFVHSILVNPEHNEEVFCSVSCAGVFKTFDSGKTWECYNQGMKATYLPNPTPEAGYDPHLMLMSDQNHSVLWQQNHCGIYKSINGGRSWIDITGKEGFPGYGFCIAIEENGTEEAWVIPVEDETKRIPKDLKLRVFKTMDGGNSWINASNGLPKDEFFGIVLRNGFVKKGNLMAFGTTNGNLYFSDNKGESWKESSVNMVKVSYISFVK